MYNIKLNDFIRYVLNSIFSSFGDIKYDYLLTCGGISYYKSYKIINLSPLSNIDRSCLSTFNK